MFSSQFGRMNSQGMLPITLPGESYLFEPKLAFMIGFPLMSGYDGCRQVSGGFPSEFQFQTSESIIGSNWNVVMHKRYQTASFECFWTDPREISRSPCAQRPIDRTPNRSWTLVRSLKSSRLLRNSSPELHLTFSFHFCRIPRVWINTDNRVPLVRPRWHLIGNSVSVVLIE